MRDRVYLASPLPPSAVVARITVCVENDYIARGIFPELRHARCQGTFTAAGALHFLSLDFANEILADAIARQKTVSGPMLISFRALVQALRREIADAVDRPAAFARPLPTRTEFNELWQTWRGDKAQLRAHGVRLDGPWPGEPGGGKRWAYAAAEGFQTVTVRMAKVWPGIFFAEFRPPYQPKADPDADAETIKRAKFELACMPKSAQAYTDELVACARKMLRVALASTEACTSHGYSIDQEALADIAMSFDAVAEAIAAAPIRFDAARHAAAEQKHRAIIAACDTSFQARITDLTRLQPGLLGDER